MQSLLNALIVFMGRATVAENVFLRVRRPEDAPRFRHLHCRVARHPADGREWIGTSDASLISRVQAQLLGRFRGSSSVVLASHRTQLLRELCNKALVLDNGRMRFFGAIAEGLEVYRDIVARQCADMQRQVIQSDPLLFGDVVGLIERVRFKPGLLEVEGWAMGPDRRPIAALLVEVRGQRIAVERFETVDREDVRRHLGRQSGNFGFRLRVPVAAHHVDADTAPAVSVHVCGPGGSLGPPLALAAGAIVGRAA